MCRKALQVRALHTPPRIEMGCIMLSLEQQKTIENSVWVVNTALKKQGLRTDEDLRQSAILYMCKCLERFDPTKQIKWTTYAYKSVFLYIKRTHAKEMKRQSLFVDDDILTLKEQIADPMEQPQHLDGVSYKIDKIKAVCSMEEKQIIDLKLKGYKVVEISSLMKCSPSKINGCMQSIKEKAKEIEF